jgi:hypothetical protein
MTSWWACYDGTIVMCALHLREAPTDAEWTAYLKQVSESMAQGAPTFERLAGLAISDGGAPTVMQRKQLLKVTREIRTPTTAVVSDNALVRGVAIALSWFNYRIRFLGPEDFDEALTHLNVPPSSRAKLLADIRRHAQALGQIATVEKLRL